MQHYVPKRICIYAKDVERITGRKERTARKLMSEIREKLGKRKGDFISVQEFAEHTGLRVEEIEKMIID